jgi:RimJ/RimL family protein N-acetyltransferase
MLSGSLVGLRDLRRADVELLHDAMANDAVLHSLTSVTPWVPVPVQVSLATFDKMLADPTATTETVFAIQRLDDPDGGCLGSINLWGISQHHRVAHIGVGLLPAARHQGLGRDAVATICRYAFEVRDLARLQLETLDVNTAMQATAAACGFVLEGRMRSQAWHLGRRADELVYGLLADEWRARAAG